MNTRKKVPWRFILISSSIIPIVVYFIPIAINATPTVGINQTGNSTNQLGQAASNDTVGWETFQESQDGFKLQAPADWKKPESTDFFPIPDFTISPEDPFIISSKTKVVVEVENSSSGRTLDPTTLEVKSLPVEPVEKHARDFIDAVNSDVIEGDSIDVIKSQRTTFAGEPAWNVQYIINYEGYQSEYGSKFFVIKDDRLFDVTFTSDPMKVPEMRPIGEKILQSFQFTTPQPQAPNAPEQTTSEPEQSDSTSDFPSAPEAVPDEENEDNQGNQDDQSTDEDDNNSLGGDEENLFG